MPKNCQDIDYIYHDDNLEKSGAYMENGMRYIPAGCDDRAPEFVRTAQEAFNFFVFKNISDTLKNKSNKNENFIVKYFIQRVCDLYFRLQGCPIPNPEFVDLRPSLSCFLDYLCSINISNINMLSWKSGNLLSLDKLADLKKMSNKEDDSFNRRARRNRNSMGKLITGIYRCWTRVLVLRIDLSYRHNSCHPKDVTREVPRADRNNIDFISQHRGQFVKHLNFRFNKSLLGYMWRLEYSEQQGYHLHAFILLDGNFYQDGVLLCNELGEEWSNVITKKQGLYYNCNDRKSKYRNLAIGMTTYADKEQRVGIDNIANYFVKDDWLFQVKADKSHRTIGRSGIPEEVEIS